MGLRRPAPPARSAEATLAAKREGMARKRAADPEAARLRERAYHAANRPKQIAKMRAYYGRRFFWAKSMKLRGISSATPQNLARLWRRQRGFCALTGRRLDRTAEIDHRLPKARGGGDEIANLQWVTREANRAKRDLTDAEFLTLCSDCTRAVLPDILAALSTPDPSPGGDRGCAEAFARRAHADHVDKAGLPYTGHLGRVAARARAHAEAQGLSAADAERCEIVGWLHDTVEDTGATADDLHAAGFDRETVNAVLTLSRSASPIYAEMTYADYIEGIAAYSGPEVHLVKLADLDDNLDPARGASLSKGLWRRYEAARAVLIDALPTPATGPGPEERT